MPSDVAESEVDQHKTEVGKVQDNAAEVDAGFVGENREPTEAKETGLNHMEGEARLAEDGEKAGGSDNASSDPEGGLVEGAAIPAETHDPPVSEREPGKEAKTAVESTPPGTEEGSTENETSPAAAEVEAAERGRGPLEGEETADETTAVGEEEGPEENGVEPAAGAVVAGTTDADGVGEERGKVEAEPGKVEEATATATSMVGADEAANGDQGPDEAVTADETDAEGAGEEAAVGGAVGVQVAGAAAIAAGGEAVPGQAEEEAALESRGIFAGLDEVKKRRRLLFVLLLLLALLLCAGVTFWRYLRQPVPLPELLPLPGTVNYPPHYLYSIPGVEAPVGVALSPDGERIYATETGGERMVRVFDRDGGLLYSFAPPRTGPAHRAPVYLAVDGAGRVYVTDRLQHAVFVFDRDGGYLDTILSPDLTLSEHVSEHVNGLQSGAELAYNAFEPTVYYQEPGQAAETLPLPNTQGWSPLGIRVTEAGKILLTDVSADHHCVREISGDAIETVSWQSFDPPQIAFGTSGQGTGEFLFPNSAVADSQGRVYVTDGNNGRISVWSERGEFLYNFGQGAGDGALSLPRGAAIDRRDRLHVVDTVEQNVKVYDVSGLEPRFLFAFGDWGGGEAHFNYPNDIALDASGRLYVADRENDRIQVWSY